MYSVVSLFSMLLVDSRSRKILIFSSNFVMLHWYSAAIR
jgi:hypothetical protein